MFQNSNAVSNYRGSTWLPLTVWRYVFVDDFEALSCQVTRKVEAGYKPSHTTKALFGYIACWAFVILFLY